MPSRDTSVLDSWAVEQAEPEPSLPVQPVVVLVAVRPMLLQPMPEYRPATPATFGLVQTTFIGAAAGYAVTAIVILGLIVLSC